MKLILLSGGSGKRLWPLSGEVRSKAFLKLLPAPDGGRESMLERVVRQLTAAGLLESTHIITHYSQLELIRSQTGDKVPILTEPHKRGTLTAIALACAQLQAQPGADPEEVLLFMPVDPYVEASFYDRLRELPTVLRTSGASLALLGTRPASPSTQYGYIVPQAGEPGLPYYPVARFVEKPEPERADQLLQEGALWNCGIFAFTLGFITRTLQEYGLPIDPEQLLERYESLPETSFDKEIVEHTPGSIVVPYEGSWEDLGSWEAFTRHLGGRQLGIGSVSTDSLNTHLVSELDRPIHIIGLSDLIVAASEAGILVSSKADSSRIKEILPGDSAHGKGTPFGWGNLELLSPEETDGQSERYLYRLKILPGCRYTYESLPGHQTGAKHLWIILSGAGLAKIGGQDRELAPGVVLSLDDRELEYIQARQSGIEAICVQMN
ncbi:sugar phosphate nucleotidyltransferase [Paenibacillus sp. J22TS3]|uniref:sugar phosphate nucleotidyltransferase n=1 Tax=Paenibacillus sp. J22TS3 TaxID=2807192 RepID=UPI001B2744A9|nr:sugar phosphate nucleotidyltransferase [Paenibacillus sp. J22TS3]GIP23619.1 mannose-1-phosphate guanylyltransferase [Paenibacillus sp. J22TS3]